jgi:dihydroorotate dehydrogenase (fumarate)
MPALEHVQRRDVRARVDETSSLNTLGYSPVSFEEYMEMLVGMSRDGSLGQKAVKPFIVSVSGSALDVRRCAVWILRVLNESETLYPLSTSRRSDGKSEEGGDNQPGENQLNLMMEINLSCPNIPDKPPPAYDGPALSEYIAAIAAAKTTCEREHPAWKGLHVGIKTPPYTHAGQFNTLISALESSAQSENGCPISFITATNTLGSCLVFSDTSPQAPALASSNSTGIGGLAGSALHPLALGNVKTIRGLLDNSPYEDVRGIQIIGIGGVSDADGWRRMRAVGACAVGVGTALGREGKEVFQKIAKGVGAEEFGFEGWELWNISRYRVRQVYFTGNFYYSFTD